MEIEKIFNELRTEFKKFDSGLIENKKQIAPDFNAFEILYALELPLSRMIGEFLNPKGNHAHGQVFLDLFIDKFLRNNLLVKKSKNISVKLEHVIENGRIDILIDFDDKFGIAIENKPYADDQNQQIIRYCNHLSSVYGNNNFAMIYLSADGSEPTEKSLTKNEREQLGKQFIIISYPQLRTWYLDCAVITEKSKSDRLTAIINEFAEYINRVFCDTNSLKDNMIGETIKYNIIDAYEIIRLWNKNKPDYENLWKNTINNLINKELPKLVFDKLISDKIIDENWKYIEGKLDIETRHIEGFKIINTNWKYFEYGIFSWATIVEKGTKAMFPLIISKENKQINNPNFIKEISQKTETEMQKMSLRKPSAIWYSSFPDKNFQIWDYDQWIEIKPNGKTVEYVAKFLEKLINASFADIDYTENFYPKSNFYTENDFKNFINKFQWIFAKTYADKAPHEYIVLDKIGLQHKDEFVKIAQFIREVGFKAMYYTREGYYYKLDENYYWTMDDDLNDTNLINRAKFSDYDLIDNTWYWKGQKLNNDEK
jgi:hypothetical protein